MKQSPRLLFVLMACLLTILLQPASAKQAQDDQVRVINTSEGLILSWSDLHVQGVDTHGAPILAGWQQQLRDSYRIPTFLLTVELMASSSPAITIEQIKSSVWLEPLDLIADQAARTLMGEQRFDIQPTQAQLPTQPITILRQSIIQGKHMALLAISPLFDAGDGPILATALQATLTGVRTMDPLQLQRNLSTGTAQLSARPASITAPAPQSAARQAIASVRVTQAGMVRISASNLTEAGLQLATLQPATLQLWHNDSQLAIEIIGGDDGSFDIQDEIRFFVPSVDDRWNRSAVYWLLQGSTAGLRIASRAVIPGSAPISSVALEHGLWRQQRRYDSLLPGPLGDYWYAEDMRTGSGLPVASTSLVLTPTLPLAAGPIDLTLYATAYTKGTHNLQIQLGAVSQTTTWSGTGNWSALFQFASQHEHVLLELLPGAVPDGIELQAIRYTRPVQLSTQGQGALFSGYADQRRYQISGATEASVLYDITNPKVPIRLLGQYATGNYVFEDLGAHDYVLTGSTTLRDASLMLHQPIDMRADLNLQAIYIAPASFHAALEPLIAYRNAQGIRAGVVDVQHIYDAWSGGHVSPNAIRDFLRYAYASWATAPAAVILVGDGSADPFDNLRYGAKNLNIIPPYLAHVDPWIGETACDSCYAQLDGSSPLDDLLPDIMFGRFPVKNVVELSGLVSKILRYEQARGAEAWKFRIGLVTDNYTQQDGSHDGAGDFASIADSIAERAPDGIAVKRLYYDPGPTRPIDQPWREPNEDLAHKRTIDLINNGAALITYIGHSHQWQWAVTNQQSTTSSYLLGLYDTDLLNNENRLAIIRELTCLTGAFQTPTYEGTTIDERLLIMPGGAAAIWGSSGLSVANGHDMLALGFDRALWQANKQGVSLGILTQAGLLELYSSSTCCNDILRTYLLLGDPFTQLQIGGSTENFLPLVHR